MAKQLFGAKLAGVWAKGAAYFYNCWR